MNRRDFIKAAAAGSAAPLAICASANPARAEQACPTAGKVDPEELARRAVHHFMDGKLTCSESVLMAGCEVLGIQSELIPDVALGLAAGIGLQGKACGCVTASAMVLSLAAARHESDYAKKKVRALTATGKLVKQFEKTFGTTQCRKISGLDLTTPEGRRQIETVVKAATCRKVVEETGRMLGQLLQA